MAFLNKFGNGASMTNSIDVVCNSISLIGPDGTLTKFTGSASGTGVVGPVGDIGGVGGPKGPVSPGGIIGPIGPIGIFLPK